MKIDENLSVIELSFFISTSLFRHRMRLIQYYIIHKINILINDS